MKRNDKLEAVLLILLIITIMAMVEWVALKGYDPQKSDRPGVLHFR
jgi:hypothetical protein